MLSPTPRWILAGLVFLFFPGLAAQEIGQSGDIDWSGAFPDFPLAPHRAAAAGDGERWIDQFVTDYTRLDPAADPNAGIRIEMAQQDAPVRSE